MTSLTWTISQLMAKELLKCHNSSGKLSSCNCLEHGCRMIDPSHQGINTFNTFHGWNKLLHYEPSNVTKHTHDIILGSCQAFPQFSCQVQALSTVCHSVLFGMAIEIVILYMGLLSQWMLNNPSGGIRNTILGPLVGIEPAVVGLKLCIYIYARLDYPLNPTFQGIF